MNELCLGETYSLDLLTPNPQIPYNFYIGNQLVSMQDLEIISELHIENGKRFYNSCEPDKLESGIIDFYSNLSVLNKEEQIYKAASITSAAIGNIIKIFNKFNQAALVIIKAEPAVDSTKNYKAQIHADPCFEQLTPGKGKQFHCQDKYAVTFTLSGTPTYFYKPSIDQALEFDNVTNGRYNFMYSDSVNNIYSNSTPMVANVGEAMVFKMGRDGAHHAVPPHDGTQRIWVGVFPINKEYTHYFIGEGLDKLLDKYRTENVIL